MAIDQDGNVIIAHVGRGAIWVYNPMGLPTHMVDASSGGRHATNIAYGGPDNRSLFITNSFGNNILRAEMPVPGETMYGLMD